MFTKLMAEKVVFGPLSKYDSQHCLIVPSYLEVPEELQAQVKHFFVVSCDETYEPQTIDQFEEELKAPFALLNCKEENRSCYIADHTGLGFSAFIAMILYCRLKIKGIEQSIDTVSNAIRSQNTLPAAFREDDLPIYARQRFFMRWYLKGITWKTMSQKHRRHARGVAQSQRASKIMGSIRCGELMVAGQSARSYTSYLEGYTNIEISDRKNNEWRELHACFLGPYTYPFVTVSGVRRMVFSQNLHNLMMSMEVHPCHLEEDGTLKVRWYQTREVLCDTLKAFKKHPDQKYNKEYKPIQPLYYIWDGQQLTKHEARLLVFTPLYEQEVRKGRAWKEMLALQNAGTNIHFIGPRCQSIHESGMSYMDFMLDDTRHWCEPHILKGMMENRCLWQEDNLINPRPEEDEVQ